MKLTTVKATLKNHAAKLLAAAALAGAVVAAAPAAQAQRVVFGVHFGGPVYDHAYYGPRYVAPPPPVVYDYGYRGYYDHRDWRYDHRFDRRFDHRFDHRVWR
jgi:hypothetical protein